MVAPGTLLRATCAALLLASAAAARSQDTSLPDPEDWSTRSPAPGALRWTVDATVYGWLAGATGDITPFTGAPTLEFDNSFGDVLEDLDAAFFTSVHARKEKLILLADLSYASLSREGLVPPGIPAEGKLSQFSFTAAAGARIADTPQVAVDLLAGARLWIVDGSVDVPLAGLNASPDKTFVDPIVGARAVAQIAPRLSVLGYADIGGVGVGSDFTYQVIGTLNYRVGRNFFISVGYRHLGLDYSEDGTVFEGSMTGPLLGLTKRF